MFHAALKSSHFGLKMTYLSILGEQIEKYIAIFANQRPQSGKFHTECKKFQFGNETALFRLTPKKLLTYLKSAPSNLSKCRISGKSIKPLNLAPKILFWLRLG